jgi:hypothetical protein
VIPVVVVVIDEVNKSQLSLPIDPDMVIPFCTLLQRNRVSKVLV